MGSTVFLVKLAENSRSSQTTQQTRARTQALHVVSPHRRPAKDPQAFIRGGGAEGAITTRTEPQNFRDNAGAEAPQRRHRNKNGNDGANTRQLTVRPPVGWLEERYHASGTVVSRGLALPFPSHILLVIVAERILGVGRWTRGHLHCARRYGAAVRARLRVEMLR